MFTIYLTDKSDTEIENISQVEEYMIKLRQNAIDEIDEIDEKSTRREFGVLQSKQKEIQGRQQKSN